MTSALPGSIQYGKVTLRAVVLKPAAGSAALSATGLLGTVTFSAPEGVLLINDSAEPMTAFLRGLTYGLDPNGVLRDEDNNVGVSLISPYSTGLSKQGWKWTASFRFQDSGVVRDPIIFDLPANSTVDLTRAAPVSQTPTTIITQGPPGLSAYQVAVSKGFQGTEEAWLASLVGFNGTLADNQIPASIARDTEVAAAVDAASASDRARSNHTGSQAISTVTGLQTALDGKQAAGNYVQGGQGIDAIVKITQAAYDALTTKPANVLYVIEG